MSSKNAPRGADKTKKEPKTMNDWKENPDYRSSTLQFDKALFKHDIMGSIAHCTMLGELGVISEDDMKALRSALSQIFYDITSGDLVPADTTGIMSFLDEELEDRVGDIAALLDIARTADDRAVLDIRLYLVESVGDVRRMIKETILSAVEIARSNTSTVMPSMYRGGKGQPTTLAHMLAAHSEALLRDIGRLTDASRRANMMSLYSGYGTGTLLSVDKQRVSELLNMEKVAFNAFDALNDKDYIYEAVSAFSTAAAHIKSFAGALDTLVYARPPMMTLEADASPLSPTLAGETALSRATSAANRCISLCGTFRPDLTCEYDAIRALESLVGAIDSLEDGISSLDVALTTAQFDARAMAKAATEGFTIALDCVDLLVQAGAAREDARSVTEALALYCEENGRRPESLTADELTGISPLLTAEIAAMLKPKAAVKAHSHEGEPSDRSVRAELRHIAKSLARFFKDEDDEEV